MKNRKVTVIGAGMVGSATALNLAHSNLFEEVVLVDINAGKAKGEALDIAHCAAFIKSQVIVSGSYEETKDSDIVVITAGRPQAPGESRLALVDKNVAIFKDMIANIKKYSPKTILVVVSNPVDILSWVSFKLSGFPAKRVIGSGTVLDSSRLKYNLGKRFNVDPRSVHAYILGEHGDSEVANYESATIGSIPLKSFAEQTNIELETLKPEVEKAVIGAAGEIIVNKGYTNFAIAASVTRICEAIIRDEKAVLPVSTYDKKNNAYYSLPTILGREGQIKTFKPTLSSDEEVKLQNSIDVMKKLIGEIKLD